MTIRLLHKYIVPAIFVEVPCAKFFCHSLRYICVLNVTLMCRTFTDLEMASSSPRLSMRAGDLLELMNSDITSSPSTSSSRAESHDVEWLYGRNETTGERGLFAASSVYILPTVDRPTPDFIVSKLHIHRVRKKNSPQYSIRSLASTNLHIFS